MSVENTEAALVSSFEGLLAAEDAEEEGAPPSGSQSEEPDDDAPAEAEAADADEAEAETEAEGEDEADDAESDEPAVLEFEVDGQTVRLTAEEAKDGYLRASDYTRKTQEVARDRDAIAEQRKAFEAERQQAYQQFEQQLHVLMSMQEPEPDWKSIRAEDPLGYINLRAEWDEKQGARNKVLTEHRQRAQEAQQKAERQRQEHLQKQDSMIPEIIPEWRDQSTRQQQSAALRQALLDDGFDPKDVAMVGDARLVKWLLAGQKWMDLQKSKPAVVKKKTEGKPKVTKPGTTPPVDRKVAASRQTAEVARKSQRPQDWVKVFERFV